jgi:hypothetical protein
VPPGGTDLPGVTYTRGLFGPGTPTRGQPTIVFSHCLEHVFDLRGVVARPRPRCRRAAARWRRTPEIEAWLAESQPGALNWEHTFWVPMPQLLAMFAAHGLALVTQARFRNHSHFLALEPAPPAAPAWPGPAAAAANAAAVGAYLAGYSRKVAALNEALAASRPRPSLSCPPACSRSTCWRLASRAGCRWRGRWTMRPPSRASGSTAPSAWASRRGRRRGRGLPTVVVNGGMHAEAMIEGLRAMNPELTILDAALYEERRRDCADDVDVNRAAGPSQKAAADLPTNRGGGYSKRTNPPPPPQTRGPTGKQTPRARPPPPPQNTHTHTHINLFYSNTRCSRDATSALVSNGGTSRPAGTPSARTSPKPSGRWTRGASPKAATRRVSPPAAAQSPATGPQRPLRPCTLSPGRLP